MRRLRIIRRRYTPTRKEDCPHPFQSEDSIRAGGHSELSLFVYPQLEVDLHPYLRFNRLGTAHRRRVGPVPNGL